MLAEQLRGLGSQPPRSGTPPAPDVEQLRRLLQALGTPPGQATAVSGSDGADAIAQSARGGVLAAADGLIEAIDTAAQVLR